MFSLFVTDKKRFFVDCIVLICERSLPGESFMEFGMLFIPMIRSVANSRSATYPINKGEIMAAMAVVDALKAAFTKGKS